MLERTVRLARLSHLGPHWTFEEVTGVPEWNAVDSTQIAPKLAPTLYAGSAEFAALIAEHIRNGWAGGAKLVRPQVPRSSGVDTCLAPLLLNHHRSGPKKAAVR